MRPANRRISSRYVPGRSCWPQRPPDSMHNTRWKPRSCDQRNCALLIGARPAAGQVGSLAIALMAHPAAYKRLPACCLNPQDIRVLRSLAAYTGHTHSNGFRVSPRLRRSRRRLSCCPRQRSCRLLRRHARQQPRLLRVHPARPGPADDHLPERVRRRRSVLLLARVRNVTDESPASPRGHPSDFPRCHCHQPEQGPQGVSGTPAPVSRPPH
jgi:hypothetical protein